MQMITCVRSPIHLYFFIDMNKELQGRITELETIEVSEPEPVPQIEAPTVPTEVSL